MQSEHINDYQLRRQVSRGAFATISVALDPDGREVILRRLADGCNHRKPRKRFLKGAKLQMGMDHPCIQKVEKLCEDSNPPCMVLEYHEARDLRNLIVNKDRALQHHPISLIIQLGEALQYMHIHNCLHLDCKPENILVTKDNNLILIDFDLAQKYKPGKPVKLKKLSGTKAYLAPEVILTKKATEQSDIYSFGIVCHEIMCGHKPRASFNKTLSNDCTQYNYRHNKDPMPLKIKPIINKCVAKRPENRYWSMALVLNDIQTAL